jgi:hypothetical protein
MQHNEYKQACVFIENLEVATSASAKSEKEFYENTILEYGMRVKELSDADIFKLLYSIAVVAEERKIIIRDTFLDIDNNLAGYLEMLDCDFSESNEMHEANLEGSKE